MEGRPSRVVVKSMENLGDERLPSLSAVSSPDLVGYVRASLNQPESAPCRPAQDMKKTTAVLRPIGSIDSYTGSQRALKHQARRRTMPRRGDNQSLHRSNPFFVCKLCL